MDITLKIGTPLLAVADGKVIHKGTFGRLVGNYIWIYFSPDSTGLPVHLFAKYQHLDSPSRLEVGEKVSVGQSVGLSGKTGTTGGHFGFRGYPHLHIMFQISESSEYIIKGPKIGPREMNYLDPMGLYLPRPVKNVNNHLLRDLPEERKLVSVSVKTTNEKVVPVGSKVVWPVTCQTP